MRVWVYPERMWEELGAERYAVEWYTVKPGYVEGEESPDPGIDMNCNVRAFKTLAAATREAKKRINDDYFGNPTIRKQVVDWYVEEDKIAEWSDVGEPIYID